MKKSLAIGIFCTDFDAAKNFYTSYLDFDVDLDEVITYGNKSFRRLVLLHRLLTFLKI
jgi:catechol 2,3-dioxygenase-like lactoylglutathione lyase family enzyme